VLPLSHTLSPLLSLSLHLTMADPTNEVAKQPLLRIRSWQRWFSDAVHSRMQMNAIRHTRDFYWQHTNLGPLRGPRDEYVRPRRLWENTTAFRENVLKFKSPPVPKPNALCHLILANDFHVRSCLPLGRSPHALLSRTQPQPTPSSTIPLRAVSPNLSGVFLRGRRRSGRRRTKRQARAPCGCSRTFARICRSADTIRWRRR
jgi:hypothetical protein